MTDVLISGDVAERLLEVAQQENTPVNDLLRSMLEERVVRHQHASELDVDKKHNKKMLEFLGAFDDDVPDISSTVRETLEEFYRKKYGNIDTD